MDIQKIILGSAQFGMHYGISNQTGQVHENEILKILELARKNGIHKIDTASQYGSSELVLGKLPTQDFSFITKLRPLPEHVSVHDYVESECLLSLKNINKSVCEGLLVHQAEDLLGKKGLFLYEALLNLKNSGRVKKIGVSVYFPQQAYELIERFDLDIIQLPLNLFDQRFLKNQLLTQIKNRNIEIHARSIFLQGLLLMPEENIPDYFSPIKPHIAALHQASKKLGSHIRAILINFVCAMKEIDHYIFGIENEKQLAQIINDYNSPEINFSFPDYDCSELPIVNPLNWKLDARMMQ